MTSVSSSDRLLPVPVCLVTDSLLSAWQSLQFADTSWLIVCDRHQVPLGGLTVQMLLPYLTLRSPPGNLGSPKAESSPAESVKSSRKRKKSPPSESVALSTGADLTDGGVTGTDLTVPDTVPDTVSTQDVSQLSIAAFLQQNRLTLEPIAPLAAPPCPSPLPLSPLIDLLERLPLPLMLQTSMGLVITQNLAWRQQIGELQNPELIQREAAAFLETASVEASSAALALAHELVTRAKTQLQPNASQWSDLDSTFLKDWVNRTDTPHADEKLPQSLCQLSADPDSCVCFCPMKTGQDRIWRFSKISLGTSLSPLTRSDLIQSGAIQSAAMPSECKAEETAVDLAPFHLATLDFNPDPTWDSLMQTENLWLVLAQDITEQQQVARELAAKNADLVQLNRLKDEFLACISHELKTPLTAVLGLSSLLKDQALGDLNERQSRYAQLIYQSGRHLMWVVNDILDVTRIETGQLELSLATVRIQELCWRSYEQAQQLETVAGAESASIGNANRSGESTVASRFNLEISPGLETLIADELRLRQMLANLLSNALKFTEPEGSLGLKVEYWDNWIAFTVWDTGIGIPADKQHLVFQKFQQLENPLTRQFKGTGLGLVLTQRLARLHGGDVTFTSIEGKGSQFTLLMPPVPPQAVLDFNQQFEADLDDEIEDGFLGRSGDGQRQSHSAPKFTMPLAPITQENRLILVVEAAPRLIEAISEPLVDMGYRVAIARSGTEALEKSRRLQPAVIFLNPLLPALSGWDVLTLLKADGATKHIPVVVTAMRTEREQALRHHADRFLSLPIKPAALEECLAVLLQSEPEPALDGLLKLTILHLQAGESSAIPGINREMGGGATPSHFVPGHPVDRPLVDALNQLLHPHHCRLLEVDDLEQADLLARVWRPDVILLDGIAAEPERYLETLSLQPFLTELPIVTLTLEMTQAANLMPDLTVFPCLSQSTASQSTANQSTANQSTTEQTAPKAFSSPQSIAISQEKHPPKISTLLQVLQLAANRHATPHILIVDLLQSQLPTTLSHYLQMAGFHSAIVDSWQSIPLQLQRHSIDLLLICVDDTIAPTTAEALPRLFLGEIEQTLAQLDSKPSVFVWCPVHSAAMSDRERRQHLQKTWGAIATHILPPQVSTADLLTQINQTVRH